MHNDTGDGSHAGAAGAAPRIVLFDFDGVLFRGDAFSRFVIDSLRRSRWRRALALLLSLPLLPTLPFTRRWVARQCVVAVLFGLSEARYSERAGALGHALAREPGRFYREGLTTLRRHLADGDRVIIVTGCEERLAQTILDELGLTGMELVASRLRPRRLGMAIGRYNVGARKPVHLSESGIGTTWDRAYSDSIRDVPMLRDAREAVLVNASPKRCKAVEKALGRSVIRVHWH